MKRDQGQSLSGCKSDHGGWTPQGKQLGEGSNPPAPHSGALVSVGGGLELMLFRVFCMTVTSG